MRKKHVYFIFLCILFIFIIIILLRSNNNFNPPSIINQPLSTTCQLLVDYLNNNTNDKVLIIDKKVLDELLDNKCNDINDRYNIQVAMSHPSKRSINTTLFNVILYDNELDQDYLDMHTTPRRIIPKNIELRVIGNIQIPKDMKKFKVFWERSEYMECRNIDMKRNDTKYKLDKYASIDSLAMIRDELISFNMYPFLFFGTLLGWYRECGIIPHTHDMDLAVHIDQYNPLFVDKLKSDTGNLILKRLISKPTDGLEMTIKPREADHPVDIFFMYTSKYDNGTEYNWVGGLDRNLVKYQFYWPSYGPLCTGIINNHYFWTICSPLKWMEYEYGPTWSEDVTEFEWNKSAKNVRENGYFYGFEMGEVIQEY